MGITIGEPRRITRTATTIDRVPFGKEKGEGTGLLIFVKWYLYGFVGKNLGFGLQRKSKSL